MTHLEIKNSKTHVSTPLKILQKLRKEFRVKAPGRFFSPLYRKRQWDGYIYFISEAGYIYTGLLPKLFQFLDELGEEYEIEDSRDNISPGKIPKKLNQKKLRGYQIEAIKAITERYVGGIYFPRGIIKAATNAGKTFIIAGLFKSFNTKALVLINQKDLFDQLVLELPELLPGKVGQIGSGKIVWGDLMICMVKTLGNRIKNYEVAKEISQYQSLLVDECDLATSKTYTNIINNLNNAFVRVGMSGTALVDLRAKKADKNEKLRAIFGDLIFEISNKELIDQGHSSKIQIVITPGNKTIVHKGDYEREEKKGILKNKGRNKRIWKRAKKRLSKNQYPLLIVVKRHLHIEKLIEYMPKEIKEKYRWDWIHHEKKDRASLIADFKKGKLDILISSMIVKRGQNFPLMKSMINAGGGDDPNIPLQLLGRATRKHGSKDKTYYEDFYDNGFYLKRHSNRRIRIYKNENIRVIKKY